MLLTGQSSVSCSQAEPSTGTDEWDTGEHDLEKGLMEQRAAVGRKWVKAARRGWSSIFHGWETVEEEQMGLGVKDLARSSRRKQRGGSCRGRGAGWGSHVHLPGIAP